MQGGSHILEWIFLLFSFKTMLRPVENNSYASASRDYNFEIAFIEVKRLVMPNSTLLLNLPLHTLAIDPFLLQIKHLRTLSQKQHFMNFMHILRSSTGC